MAQQKKPVKVKKKSQQRGRPGVSPKAPKVRKATFSDWIEGARIRTLPLSVAPVALGTASGYLVSEPGWHWVRALLCLVVAVCLQVGVNYSNDYSDGVRGTDKYRVGPARLVGSGAAQPRTVLIVALVFFGFAAVAGLVLAVLSHQWWLTIIGALCIVAAYFYTGGKRPYGYNALGEVFVFVFFGLVATAGTTFVEVLTVNVESWISGVCVGLLACAVLMINNIRDLEQDRLANKRTLAVILGSTRARIAYSIFILLPFVGLVFFVIFYPNAGYVYFALLAAVPAVLIAVTGRHPKEFILALRLSSFTALLFGLGLGWAIAF